MKLKDLLKNKYVLYAVVFFSLFHVIGYLGVKDFDSLTFFIATGYLSTFFSKNMIVNLVTAIVATNIFFVGNRVREGFESPSAEEDDNADASLQDAINQLQSGDASSPSTNEAYSQMNIARSRAAALSPSGNTDESVGNRIDYATTLEQAYDNLQNMLGEDGMKGLTNQTKHLVKQQKSLVESLQSIAPALQGAKETMAALQEGMPAMGNLNGMIEQMTDTFKNKKK